MSVNASKALRRTLKLLEKLKKFSTYENALNLSQYFASSSQETCNFNQNLNRSISKTTQKISYYADYLIMQKVCKKNHPKNLCMVMKQNENFKTVSKYFFMKKYRFQITLKIEFDFFPSLHCKIEIVKNINLILHKKIENFHISLNKSINVGYYSRNSRNTQKMCSAETKTVTGDFLTSIFFLWIFT